MYSNKMSEMNSLESRDPKQNCRGRIKGFLPEWQERNSNYSDPAHTSEIRMQANERLLSLFKNLYFLYGGMKIRNRGGIQWTLAKGSGGRQKLKGNIFWFSEVTFFHTPS